MKFRIAGLTVLLTVLAVAPSFAQSPISLKVGLNSNKLIIKGEDPSDSKIGLVAGIAIKAGGNDIVSFVPEILFSQKGAKFSDGDDFTLSVNYIDIPLLLHVNIPTGGSTRPFIAVGPAFSIKLSASSDPTEPGFDVSEFFKTVDVGFAVGGGVQVARRVSFEVRFQQSIAGILTDAGIDGFEAPEAVKNRTLSFLVGLGR